MRTAHNGCVQENHFSKCSNKVSYMNNNNTQLTRRNVILRPRLINSKMNGMLFFPSRSDCGSNKTVVVIYFVFFLIYLFWTFVPSSNFQIQNKFHRTQKTK